MSELRNEISKTTIRGELNLLYSMSKLIVTIIDAAPDSEIACNTLCSVAESIMDQATYVHTKICKYTSEIKESGSTSSKDK